MDEDYTSYLLSGKEMVRMLVGVASAWEMAYSAYASLLNFVAPIAGGAIILDILVNVFPQGLGFAFPIGLFGRENIISAP